MRLTSLQIFALVLGFGTVACAASDGTPIRNRNGSGDGGSSTGGTSVGGSGGLASGGASFGGSAGFTSGGSTSVGGFGGFGGAAGATSNTGGSGGSGLGGTDGSGGSGFGGFGGVGGESAGGATSAGGSSGGFPFGGAGGFPNGGSGGFPSGGSAGSTGGSGGSTSGGSGGSSGGSGGSGSTQQPDCNAPMPSGGTLHTGNGTGGQGNLAWEIWSNAGQGMNPGQLTTFSVPAFIASWNNSGGYLGRLGFEWGRFGDNPVPHTQRGRITAQFVAKKDGNAGGYSYIGMYGWTTNPCVEWYVVEDAFNGVPFNPGGTVNKGEITVDGGTYIVYTRDTTGTGGSRCSGVSNWIQYYSMRKSSRTCGVISLTEHFEKWQALGMNMNGALLEAKILVEVGGGVGHVDLPIANVMLE